MSLVRLPVIDCDVCHQLSRQHIGDPWMTAQDLRHSAARAHWVRRGRQDVCPHCAGYYDDRTCPVCGRDYICSYEGICQRCTGEALPDPVRDRTVDDAYRDELRAIGTLQ